MKNESEKNGWSLTEKVLGRIEKEGIQPRPRWHFVFSNGVFWTLWGVSVVVGAIAVAVTIFSVRSIAWQFYAATHATRLEFIVDSLPYVWVVILVVFIALAYVNVRRTKRGYRYPLWTIAGASVLLSLAVGLVLFVVGVGQIVDHGLARRLPFFSSTERVQERWVRPEQGLLAGDVVSIAPDASSFVLIDFHRTHWNVDTTDLTSRDLEVLSKFTQVRVVGVPAPGSSEGMQAFHACLVFPWDVQGLAERAWESGEKRPLLEGLRKRVDEINARGERSNGCEGVPPYEVLRGLRTEAN